MKAFLPDATIVPAFHGQKTLFLLQESLPACLPYHIWQRNKCSMYPTEMIYAQIRPNTVKFYPCNRYKIMLMTVVEHIQYMYTHTYAHTHTHPHTSSLHTYAYTDITYTGLKLAKYCAERPGWPGWAHLPPSFFATHLLSSN